ncbi:MAG: citrate transporter [Bacteroidetes bacterium]|nr:citrate transporter [Bacteroidota bacterium]
MTSTFILQLTTAGPSGGYFIFGIPIEFILFGLTLVGVALFHNHTLKVAITGLVAVLFYKEAFTDFSLVEHIIGSEKHEGEWNILLNLFGLLTGFTILADYFEKSGIPEKLPHILPNDWKGGFFLLILIAILSSFLDNIAAAMIGGSIAHVVFKGKVHIGYIAAIVAASNAGGAGSVVGDTTTTMMWIDGVAALDVIHAFIASFAAILFFGYFASKQQHQFRPIVTEFRKHVPVDWVKLLIVLIILVGAILTNVYLEFPAAGVWAAILLGTLFRKAKWKLLPDAIKGSIFLLSLVLIASMMPVEQLPAASWQSALILGFVSAVFDNIPLTKLALEQGGYDWGVLAYCVGFGGSMIWFGSSAGVAISNIYPQAKSVVDWVKNGWHIIVAYIIGFFVLLGTLGWHPHAPHKITKEIQATELKSVTQ